MNEFASLALLGIGCLVAWKLSAWVVAQNEARRVTLERIEADLQKVQAAVSAVAADVELALLSPTDREAKRFDRLPSLTSDALAEHHSGDELNLLLKTYTDGGAPLIYEVRYIHREVVYRSPKNGDPLAYGRARFEDSLDFAEVRILFLDAQSAGTLRGLPLEGKVKRDPNLRLLRPSAA